ncbi:MAG: glycine--tRNA ligase [Candidatus Aenigmarchaeota archaeon]|nr:glycine--tRNA ligase [Candidatus Aenigmarchaeota archaeon]
MNKYKEITEFADRRALFFPTAEIHSALSGFWDFGPMGAALRRKITELWRKEIVKKVDSVEIEGCVILPKQNFEASGHLKNFVDPLVQCKKCHKIFRADKLIETETGKEVPEAAGTKEFDGIIKKNNIKCPACGKELANVKKFNMMIGLSVGPVSKEYNAFLRPETCQNIFTSFQKIYKSSRVSLPLGISQIGKAFRNEISPRQTLVRLRELTQLETEIFFNPKKINEVEEWDRYKNHMLRLKLLKEKDTKSFSCEEAVKKKLVSGKLVAYYLAITQQFFEKCGFSPENFRFRELEDKAKAFYSKETWDFEVKSEVGWLELVANNYRTDYDLSSHQKVSGVDLSVVEDDEKFIPHVWEISMGLDRIFLYVLENSLATRDNKPIFKFPYYLNPLHVVVLPLVRKDGLDKKSREISELLKERFDVKYDEKSSIGKRYVIYDQFGVPLAVTVDYDTMKEDTVTLRDRDTQKQVRIKINKLPEAIEKFFSGEKIEKLGNIIK